MELVDGAESFRPFVLKTLSDQGSALIEDVLVGKVFVPYSEVMIPRTFYLTFRLIRLFQNASKIYIPVHLVILLIRTRRLNSYNNAARLLLRTLKELINSTIFTSVYAMSLPLSYCYGQTVQNTFKLTDLGLIISAVCSCAIFLEDRRRWKDISLYIGSQWIEAVLNSFKKQKKVPIEILNWQVYCCDPESSYALDNDGLYWLHALFT